MIEQVIEDSLNKTRLLYFNTKRRYTFGYYDRVLDNYQDAKNHIYMVSLEWWEKNKDKGYNKKDLTNIITKIIWNQLYSKKSEWYRNFRRNLIIENRLFDNQRDNISFGDSKHTPFDMDDVKKYLLYYYRDYSYVDRSWKLIIFTMRHIEGMLIKDISKELGIDKRTVRLHLSEVLGVLKNKFNNGNYN